MNIYKNNHRKNRYKGNGDRNFRKRNGNGHKINGDFNGSVEFKRKNPGRNNQNASKLIEKYNELAREALSNGDKILSENYFQHADHFIRIQAEKEKNRIAQDDVNKISNENKIEVQESQEKKSISN